MIKYLSLFQQKKLCCVQVIPHLRPLKFCEIMTLSLISKFTNDSIYHKIYVFKQSKPVLVNKDQFKPYCSFNFILTRIYLYDLGTSTPQFM